jgi:hypothetical protein
MFEMKLKKELNLHIPTLYHRRGDRGEVAGGREFLYVLSMLSEKRIMPIILIPLIKIPNNFNLI